MRLFLRSLILLFALFSFTTVVAQGTLKLRVDTDTGFGIQLGNRGQVVKMFDKDQEIHLPIMVDTSGFFIQEIGSDKEHALRGVFKNDGERVLIEGAQAEGYILNASFESKGDYIEVRGNIMQEDPTDHGATLSFRLPLNAGNALWWDGMDTNRVINDAVVFENTVTPYSLQDDNRGKDLRKEVKVSSYPFATIGTSGLGVSLAVPMDIPSIVRQKFQRDKGYMVEYDFGFAKETSAEMGVRPSSASFVFYIYTHHPRYGLRASAQKYAELFPQYFESLIPTERMGVIIDDHSVLSTREMEELGVRMLLDPMTENISTTIQNNGYRLKTGQCYNLSLLGEEIPTGAVTDTSQYSEVELQNLLWKDKGSTRALPHINEEILGKLITLAMPALGHTPDGKMMVKLGRTPFSLMTQWYDSKPLYHLAVNCSPNLPEPNISTNAYERDFEDAAPGQPKERDWDGVYVGQLTLGAQGASDPVNFNREHFSFTSLPLGYSKEAKKPFTLLTYGNIEFLKKIATTFRPAGKVVLGDLNQEYRENIMWWYTPYLDALGGTIVQLLPEQNMQQMDFVSYVQTLRLLSGAKKPIYVRYQPSGTVDMKHLLELALAYGVYPSIPQLDATDVSTNPELLVWKNYIPLIRKLNEAGWQPVNGVSRVQRGVFTVERYGTAEENNIILAIHNNYRAKYKLNLGLSLQDLGIGTVEGVFDVRTTKEMTPEVVGNTLMFEQEIEPNTTYLLGLRVTLPVEEVVEVTEDDIHSDVEIQEDTGKEVSDTLSWKTLGDQATGIQIEYNTQWGAPVFRSTGAGVVMLSFADDKEILIVITGSDSDTLHAVIAQGEEKEGVTRLQKSITKQGSVAQIFTDVQPGVDFGDAILALYAKNIIKGYDDGTFRPDQPVNRAEMLKFLMETQGFTTITPTENCFTDVPYDAWFAPYVCTAKLQGWVEGYPDDNDPALRKFVPWQEVQRVEALKMLGEIAHWNLVSTVEETLFEGTGYEDSSLWYIPYIRYAKGNDLIEEDTEGGYLPWASMTRGAMSDLMVRILNED